MNRAILAFHRVARFGTTRFYYERFAAQPG